MIERISVDFGPSPDVKAIKMTNHSDSDQALMTVVCVAYRRPAEIQVLIHAFLAQTSQDYRLMIISR